MEKLNIICILFVTLSILVYFYCLNDNQYDNNVNTALLNSYSHYLKYEKLINYSQYLQDNNIIRIIRENYNNIDIDYNSSIIHIIKINNTIKYDMLYNIFKDKEVKLSSSGNILYSEYINNINLHADKYIFDSSINSIIDSNIIYNLIPYPKNYPINNITTYLYSGQKYTGTHFHEHFNAFNYLIKGKKLWMILNDYNIKDNMNKLYLDIVIS